MSIETRLEKIELRQAEFRESVDNIVINQGDQIRKIGEIHHLLAGTEYGNGGMCGEFKELKKKVRRNTIWRIGIAGAGTAAIGLISFIFTKLASLIDTLK